jgi:tetratricopeptide (TPR) repeat protein
VATSFRDYLRLHKESWLKLQQTSPELRSYEDRALYSTWQLSFDHIERQSELAPQLLKLWAYFDNQDLWFELLREGRSGGPEWLSQLTEDELSFNQAVRVLCDHGLVEVDKGSEASGTESRGYSIHSCVHSWTIHMLNKEWDAGMAGVAMECVASYIPDKNARDSWVTQQRLARHAARCWSFVALGMVGEDGRQWVLHSLGDLYSDLRRLNEAEKMYQRALQGYEKTLGPDNTLTLDTVNNLGLLYADLGRLKEAEKMYQRALQGCEKALGPDHTSTLQTVNNLGILYADLGRLKEAEKMYQRALKGKEKALGPDHTSTLNTVNNLGILYRRLGRLDEAEKMYQQALQGYEKALGPDHTLTLETVNNLGVLYADLRRLDEAEKKFQRALQGREKALSPDYTSTLETVNNLGVLYVDLGRLDEVEKMFQRALQGFEKALSPDHTLTLDTVNNLGNLY